MKSEISKLAVIGAGTMGGTLIRALLDASVFEPEQIIATTRHTDTAAECAHRLGVEATIDNRAAIRGAEMVLETGEHPALLKDAVTTPAGCTIDGLLKLEEGGLRVTLIKAVVESTLRAGRLITE